MTYDGNIGEITRGKEGEIIREEIFSKEFTV